MPETMLALALHAPGDLRYEEIPVPTPGPSEALIRVAWCGVCGSDLPRIFTTGAHRHPLIPGHEFSGTVAALGDEAADLHCGDRVVVYPLLWCGRCDACEVGVYAQCRDYDYIGSRRDGAMAEYVLAPARNIRKIPHGVSLQAAAMTEPTAVALHALRRVGHPLTGRTIALFGAGPIGQLAAQWLQVMGVGRILAFDPDAHRLDLLRRFGVQEAFGVGGTEPSRMVMDRTAGRGADVCIDAAGVPATLGQCLASVARGGTVVALGNPSADVSLPVPLLSRLLRTEAALVGVWNSWYSLHRTDDDWHVALDAMRTARLSPAPLVSHRVSLASAPELLAAMYHRNTTWMKVLIGEEPKTEAGAEP